MLMQNGAGKREVRDYIKAAALIFLEEYRGDALRLDSVHNMPSELVKEVTWIVKEKFPGRMLIAEVSVMFYSLTPRVPSTSPKESSLVLSSSLRR